MKAFQNATLAEDQVAETHINCLQELKKVISFALALPDDEFRFFSQNGLSKDELSAHDKYVGDVLNNQRNTSQITSEEMDIIIPFTFNLGQAYSQLMTDSIIRKPNDGGEKAIEYAGKISPILNFLFAQKAKTYTTAANAPSYKNE